MEEEEEAGSGLSVCLSGESPKREPGIWVCVCVGVLPRSLRG